MLLLSWLNTLRKEPFNFSLRALSTFLCFLAIKLSTFYHVPETAYLFIHRVYAHIMTQEIIHLDTPPWFIRFSFLLDMQIGFYNTGSFTARVYESARERVLSKTFSCIIIIFVFEQTHSGSLTIYETSDRPYYLHTREGILKRSAHNSHTPYVFLLSFPSLPLPRYRARL